MKQLGLVWRTVRHLTARQVVYQVLTRLRGPSWHHRATKDRAKLRLSERGTTGYFLVVPEADKPVSWTVGAFTFLNRSVLMNTIDWNYTTHGKLWTYHLNYFDYLNQSGGDRLGMMPAEGLALIRHFIAHTDGLRYGLDPYPTSLRIMNWVAFLSRNQLQEGDINRHLYAQTALLSRRFEYHLDGNHLLENGFALLTASLYFRHDTWFRRAANLVRATLSAQILADGGHDERSPVYHQILLNRLLDLQLAIKHDTWHSDSALMGFLDQQTTRMLGWLDTITFRNGDVPMVNDAAFGMAPSTAQLKAKALRIGLTGNPEEVRMPETGRKQTTGYRKFNGPRFELFADVGAIGPAHQPGHAHADTFSFVLYVDNHPLIVDSGTSTYETGPRRLWERSTAAHNTVDLMNINSSEVWAGFRVGRRAQSTVLIDNPTTLTACHDGYRHLGISHERTWVVEPTMIQITDRLLRGGKKTSQNQVGTARLHFHPDVPVSLAGTVVEAGMLRIALSSASALQIRLSTYEMAVAFNQLRPAICVEVTFTNYLKTYLYPPDEDSLPDVLL